MIKLWKDENRNKELRDIIEKLRNRKFGCGFKYESIDEKVDDVMQWYHCSEATAKKVVWILTGDCARQTEICKKLGTEYAMYIPSSF